MTKYEKWYNQIMARSVGRDLVGYVERHHGVPKALGGSNDATNIFCLTCREHFLAHWLLTKFTSGQDRRKMLHALHRMGHAKSEDKPIIVAGWQYALARKAQRDAVLGTVRSSETRAKMSDKKASADTRAKMSASQLGRTHSQETIEKMKKSALAREYQPKGWVNTPEMRAATAQRNRDRVYTPEAREKMRRPASLETREKMRQSSAVRWARTRAAV